MKNNGTYVAPFWKTYTKVEHLSELLIHMQCSRPNSVTENEAFLTFAILNFT